MKLPKIKKIIPQLALFLIVFLVFLGIDRGFPRMDHRIGIVIHKGITQGEFDQVNQQPIKQPQYFMIVWEPNNKDVYFAKTDKDTWFEVERDDRLSILMNAGRLTGVDLGIRQSRIKKEFQWARSAPD